MEDGERTDVDVVCINDDVTFVADAFPVTDADDAVCAADDAASAANDVSPNDDAVSATNSANSSTNNATATDGDVSGTDGAISAFDEPASVVVERLERQKGAKEQAYKIDCSSARDGNAYEDYFTNCKCLDESWS